MNVYQGACLARPLVWTRATRAATANIDAEDLETKVVAEEDEAEEETEVQEEVEEEGKAAQLREKNKCDCDEAEHNPVCDTRNATHRNACTARCL